MSIHFRRGDATNTSVRALLYTVGCEHDQKLYSKSLKSKSGLKTHKEEALAHQKNKCLYCQLDFSQEKKAQRDHIRPLEKTNAGIHSWGNVLYCCSDCNQAKDKYKDGYLEFIKKKSKTEKIIKDWQKKYDPGYNHIHHNKYNDSKSLASACNSLYLDIDKVLKSYSII